MLARLSISLLAPLAQLARAVPADPTITPAALLPRQNADNFIGWLQVNSTWYSENCDAGATWYQEGGYAQCCTTTAAACYAPTACISGSQIYPLSDQSTTRTIACTENYNDTAISLCNTVFIYENTDDSSPQTDIVCGSSAVNWSYYRSIAASLTETTSSTSSSASASTTSSTGTATPTAAPSSGSKAWIAGAVVGPVVGLALIGAIIFFLMRRKKKNNVPAEAGTVTAPPGVAQYSDAKPVANGDAAYNSQDPYNQYGQTPAPQYSEPVPYQGAYAPDKKGAYQHLGQNEPPVAELGDGAAPGQPQIAELGGGDDVVSGSHTAELGGESSRK